jgi:hypothetical protein
MIKFETIRMPKAAKNNHILVSTTDTPNYSFLEVDNELYLIINTINGDRANMEGYVVPAGERLCGFRVKDFKGQKLVVDLKHVVGEVPYVGDILIVSDGKLTVGAAEGVYFKVTNVGVALTGPAIKVKVCVEQSPSPSPSSNDYGVTWDGTNTTRWRRTGLAAGFSNPVPYVAGATEYSSPFDNIMPWSGMVVSERAGGTMVAIPKFWYKLEQIENDGISIKISNSPSRGFVTSPAHMDRGDGAGERDVVYIGRYKCASDYKSKTGVMPGDAAKRSDARTGIHTLGRNIWQSDFAMWFTIWLLYLVEFANWDFCGKIGYGGGDGSNFDNMGYTDSMPYHTGTTQSSRSTCELGTQYRNIEGLWENCREWLDGCYCDDDSKNINIILNPSNFSDSSGGVPIGVPKSGTPSKFGVRNVRGTFPVFIPIASNGSVGA